MTEEFADAAQASPVIQATTRPVIPFATGHSRAVVAMMLLGVGVAFLFTSARKPDAAKTDSSAVTLKT
jgi:hypothetical protein